jgi:hypothetical protein
VRMQFKHVNWSLFCPWRWNCSISIFHSRYGYSDSDIFTPSHSAILSYCGSNNLVGHKRIHKWFQKEVKLGPHSLLQHIPWIHITFTYRIYVESSPYAEAKGYPDITLFNFVIFTIYELMNLKLIVHMFNHYATCFYIFLLILGLYPCIYCLLVFRYIPFWS